MSEQPAPFWSPDQPYNDLPKLPPGFELETKPILKLCIEARAAIGELKRAAELIPNQTVLISTFPVLESQASSEIENIVTTTDRLFQFRDDDDNADGATKEALRYRLALFEGYQSLQRRPLTTKTAEQICSQVKGVEMQVRRVPGTKLARGQTGEVIYTPPEGEELLRSLLGNWERFLHEARDLDPLIRMAVGHYQFEAIHPFTDGNGRTGRVLNSLYFISEGLLTLPILYLSRYIIRNKSDYYDLLLDVTQNANWNDWLRYILKGIHETADWTVEKIAAIRELQTQTANHVKKTAPRIYSHELVDLIFDRPYCRIQNVIEREIAGRQTASTYLKALVAAGVLTERTVGREKLFIHDRLMHVLTRDTNDWAPFSEVADS